MNTLVKIIGNFLLCVFFSVSVCLNANAAKVKQDVYYPSVTGEYTALRLLPRSANLTGSCAIGTFYVNSLNAIEYCRNDGTGTGAWGSLPFSWTQVSDNVFLTDYLLNPNLHVGIGTKTPDFKLTLLNNPGILATGSINNGATLVNGLTNSRFLWYPRKAAIRGGYTDGNQWDPVNIGTASVAFGKNNIAQKNYSVALGGSSNNANGAYAIIAGGESHTITSNFAAIGGGKSNQISGLYSIIYNGQNQTISADKSIIGGGESNQITAIDSSIAGGSNNTIKMKYSVIHGGKSNKIEYAPPGNSEGYAVIGGGQNNLASHDYTTISGGLNNIARGKFSRVGGGEGNLSSGTYANISGGQNNIASGNRSVVGGGYQNSATGDYAIVAGGENNKAGGNYAMIMGGSGNVANGDYSWAEGRNVHISSSADRTFAWGYSDDATNPINITNSDVFIIAPGRRSGNNWNPRFGIQAIQPNAVLDINALGQYSSDYVHISKTNTGDIFVIKNRDTVFTSKPVYIGLKKANPSSGLYQMQFGNANDAYLTNTGQWKSTSSRKYKENIYPLKLSEAYATLNRLKPVTFAYRASENHQLAGFIAEDVPDLVSMKTHKSLNELDFVAVLTKIIQNQDQILKEQNNRLNEIKSRFEKIKSGYSNK